MIMIVLLLQRHENNNTYCRVTGALLFRKLLHREIYILDDKRRLYNLI